MLAAASLSRTSRAIIRFCLTKRVVIQRYDTQCNLQRPEISKAVAPVLILEIIQSNKYSTVVPLLIFLLPIVDCPSACICIMHTIRRVFIVSQH